MTLSSGGNQAPGAASADRAAGFADRPQAIALVLIAGLLLRVVIAYVIAPGQGLQADLDFLKNAALTLADYGPGGFVAHDGFYQPSPVGYLYFLWPLGLAGRFLSGILGQPADVITLALLKVPAMLADLGIGILLYRAARRWFGSRAGLVAAALYLFIPMTWYESALFGQADSVGLLFLFAALLLLLEGWSEPAVAMAVLAAVIKPQNAIGLVIIGPILLRRHLFFIGSGPIPARRSRFGVLDRVLVGWIAQRQGIERLASCAVVAVAAFLITILPFDLPLLAPPGMVSVPLVSNVAGFMSLIGSLADYYHVLTANAFNAWALVGPIPLFHELSRTFIWTFDSLEVIGSIQAVTIGAALLLLMTVSVAIVLLLRDGRAAILGSFTVLALAFFALPTRAHERYIFPIFVTFALLVAGRTLSERRWRWWYVAMGVLAAINLHAVVTLAQPGFASPGLVGAPLGDLFRSDAVVIAVSVANTVLFLVLLVAWARGIAWPALRPFLQRVGGRTGAPGAAPFALPEPQIPVPGRAAKPERPAPLQGTQRANTRRTVMGWLSQVGEDLTRPIQARLSAGRPPTDNSAELATEPGGRLDRRDLWILVAILVVTFTVRAYRIDQPRTMYFDELYYASTGTEFLQYWRYGIPTEIFEYTHPHLSKYAQAVSLAAFGNDRVTGTSNIGAKVRDVSFDPAYADASLPGGYGGDRIAVATGAGVRIAPHGSFDQALSAPLPGAGLVAFDRATHRLYVATDDLSLWSIDGSALEAATAGGAAPQPVRLGQVPAQTKRLQAVAQDRLVAIAGDGQLSLIDGRSGRVLATASLPGFSGLVAIPVGNQIQLVAGVPGALIRLSSSTLEELSRIGLAATPRGMDLVDGSDYGWRNQDTLPTPTIYVALASKQMEAVQVAPDGTLKPFDIFAMPGSVVQVRWDRPSNMVHVLGLTADGKPTIYVVEPHTDSVFADAPLPFDPVAWALDVQPDTPSLDRQRALAFAADGTLATVDTGSHAWAWRLPGLIAGTLTAALMYLLARMLFRRRSVAVLLAMVMALDSLLFIQGRIAMNDSLLAFFIVAALTLLMALFRMAPRGRGRWLVPLLGLPAVGLLLGFALSTKWVGAYAIGGAVLLVLARTQPGRWLALGGLVLLTGVFGFQAIAGQPPNFTFLLVMLAVVAVTGLVIARTRTTATDAASAGPWWANPRQVFGLPFAYTMLCLLIVPVVVYVIGYIPWALADHAGTQLFAGWPPGHTGPTFLDLQSQMYHYHNDLRTPHAASSPWWAWLLGLKPVWGHLDTYSDGSQVIMLLTANPILLWLTVPAIGFGGWQAWRRRSMALAFVLIAFLSLWLPWARIDRVAFNYHWYTPLPFAYLLLAYFLAELWHGPSPRTWSLARVAFAVVLLTPALMWIFKDGLCALAGVADMNPTSFECGRSILDVALPVAIWLVGSAIAGWLILRMERPRRLVGLVIGTAALGFAVLYPAVSALPIPNGWPFIYQGLLPTWDISFQFKSNTSPVSDIPLLGIGAVIVGISAAGMVWLLMRWKRVGWAGGPGSKPRTQENSDRQADTGGDMIDDPGPQVSWSRPVDFRAGADRDVDASQPVPTPAPLPADNLMGRRRRVSAIARRFLRPAVLLTQACAVLATLALIDLGIRSAVRLEPRGWDTWSYHLPFAALRGGLPIPYDMSDTMRAQFDAFPPLPELVQGLLWRLTGSVNATGVINFIAFGLFLIYAHKVLRAPFWLVALISLTAPLVLIHTTVSYVDLFGNAFLAIGVSSCLFAYLFPQRRSRTVAIGGLAGLTLAAWSKYTMVPVAVVIFIILAAMVFRSTTAFRFSRRQAAVVIVVFAIVAAAPYAKNLAVYGNPFWPLRVPIAGAIFPYIGDPSSAGAASDRPPELKDAPQFQVFVESLFETLNPVRYDDHPRWTFDQWSPAVAHRMGGYWGAGVAVYLVLTVGLLITYRRRPGIIASIAGIGLLGFVAVLPQSNELRYYMFIPLTWAATIGMLYPQLRDRFPRVALGLLVLVLALFGYMASENWQYYQIEALDNRDAAVVWGAAAWWPVLKQGENYCVVDMLPLGFLMTGPSLSEYSIVDRSSASLCPAGTVVVTKAGIQRP